MSEEIKETDLVSTIVEGILGSGDSADPEVQYGKEELECGNCGARVSRNQKFCNDCGEPLNWGDIDG